MSYFFAASLPSQASSVAGQTERTSAQRLRGTSRASARNHARWPGSHRTRPATQHRVLVPEHQKLSILHPVVAAQHDNQAEYPARQEICDLEQHPASQPPPGTDSRGSAGQLAQSSIRAVQARHRAHTFWGPLTRTAAIIAAHTLVRVCLTGR